MEIFTIGFTKKSAERFFALLASARIDLLIDTRLNPDGQLSGFAKRQDLPYLLANLAQVDYVHAALLAPTAEILTDYRADKRWDRYVERFEALMDERGVPAVLPMAKWSARRVCLLCSEPTPDQCHRRLVAERIARAQPGAIIHHLL